MRALRPDEAHEPGTAIVFQHDYDNDRWSWPVPAGDDERTNMDEGRLVVEVGIGPAEVVRRAVDYLTDVLNDAQKAFLGGDESLLRAACDRFDADPGDRYAVCCRACGWLIEYHEGGEP